jgi:hypothetical protein
MISLGCLAAMMSDFSSYRAYFYTVHPCPHALSPCNAGAYFQRRNELFPFFHGAWRFGCVAFQQAL